MPVQGLRSSTRICSAMGTMTRCAAAVPSDTATLHVEVLHARSLSPIAVTDANAA